MYNERFGILHLLVDTIAFCSKNKRRMEEHKKEKVKNKSTLIGYLIYINQSGIIANYHISRFVDITMLTPINKTRLLLIIEIILRIMLM